MAPKVKVGVTRREMTPPKYQIAMAMAVYAMPESPELREQGKRARFVMKHNGSRTVEISTSVAVVLLDAIPKVSNTSGNWPKTTQLGHTPQEVAEEGLFPRNSPVLHCRVRWAPAGYG
eukprot:CAMPEP_0197435768 /NCGR_PEP_ID=MMETSP1175-20131217/3299_1 /TAXON_ID=1003142 /ORGANISM="Triceratium dubium, Strain CCMP147" /LENGTH=117 /DNA_ID=CAMNT_0042964883 /DNA_START=270 /DNA_END=624 /DNA_ORIENTATION=-